MTMCCGGFVVMLMVFSLVSRLFGGGRRVYHMHQRSWGYQRNDGWRHKQAFGGGFGGGGHKGGGGFKKSTFGGGAKKSSFGGGGWKGGGAKKKW